MGVLHQTDQDEVRSVAIEVGLRDGTTALIWPLLPEDRAALNEAYERLDPEAKYHRFLAAVPHLSEELLRHLVDDVDGVNHVALVMTAFDADGNDTPIGVAHLIRYPDDPRTVDLAVTVAEGFRGRGAATALARELVERRPPGAVRVLTTIAEDNLASLALLRSLGPTTVTPARAGVRTVLVDLPPESATAE